MEIRLATVEDCGEMTELRIAMREERDKEEWLIPKEQFKNNTYDYFYKNIASGEFISYVAVCDGKIVAMSGLVFYTVPPLPSVLLNGKAAY